MFPTTVPPCLVEVRGHKIAVKCKLLLIYLTHARIRALPCRYLAKSPVSVMAWIDRELCRFCRWAIIL